MERRAVSIEEKLYTNTTMGLFIFQFEFHVLTAVVRTVTLTLTLVLAALPSHLVFDLIPLAIDISASGIRG